MTGYEHRPINVLFVKRFVGDIVLDIGTGTGILAATAAKCGAARVYAVEQSSVAKLATKVFEGKWVIRNCYCYSGGIL